MQLIIRLSIDYLTLCEALTAGAFDAVNCQNRGEFDRIFSKKSNAQGFASGGRVGVLGFDRHIRPQRKAEIGKFYHL